MFRHPLHGPGGCDEQRIKSLSLAVMIEKEKKRMRERGNHMKNCK